MKQQWYELLMRPDSELRRLGLPAEVAEIREEQTGHRRSLIPRWCRSIGLWGRIATQVEMELITGVSPRGARRFSERHGLRFAGKYGRVSQFRLAANVYEDIQNVLEKDGAYDPVVVAQRHYILPIEAVLYPWAVIGFCDDQESDLHDLMDSLSEPLLAERWVNSEWVLGLPKRVMSEIGGGDDRLVTRIHRRLGKKPTTELRRTPRTPSSS